MIGFLFSEMDGMYLLGWRGALCSYLVHLKVVMFLRTCLWQYSTY